MKNEIIVLIDKSGSMYSQQSDTIGGYNKFLNDQLENSIEGNISVLMFDTEKKWWQADVPLKNASKLDKDNYKPSGGTALYDAIARASHVLEHKNPDRAIVVIVTDGEENASTETIASSVKPMLAAMQAKDYRVIYLAANQDAFKTATTLGINISGAATIRNDSIGTQSAYYAASNATMSYLSDGNKGVAGSASDLVKSFETANKAS